MGLNIKEKGDSLLMYRLTVTFGNSILRWAQKQLRQCVQLRDFSISTFYSYVSALVPQGHVPVHCVQVW